MKLHLVGWWILIRIPALHPSGSRILDVCWGFGNPISSTKMSFPGFWQDSPWFIRQFKCMKSMSLWYRLPVFAHCNIEEKMITCICPQEIIYLDLTDSRLAQLYFILFSWLLNLFQIPSHVSKIPNCKNYPCISAKYTLQETNISPPKWYIWRWSCLFPKVGQVSFLEGKYTNPTVSL